MHSKSVNIGKARVKGGATPQDLNKTCVNKAPPAVRPVLIRRSKRRVRSKSARLMRKFMRNIKKEQDPILKKLLEKSVQNIRASNVSRGGRNTSKAKIADSIQKCSIYKYHSEAMNIPVHH